jgi:DNA-binding beta-propeller fold protein YncE
VPAAAAQIGPDARRDPPTPDNTRRKVGQSISRFRTEEDTMRLKLTLVLTAVIAVMTVVLMPPDDAAAAAREGGGKVVVANRASGTISVIHTRNNAVENFDLPPGNNLPEPMYVYYSPNHRRVFVGDRANNRVVAFDAKTFRVECTVPAGNGVFHMWGSRATGQLWVNNDIDNTTSVIDMRTCTLLGDIPTPADLVADGGKPHDVIVDPQGMFGYVTVLGLPGDSDALVQFDARTYQELGRADVGKDPHVSLSTGGPYLYVPAQNSNVVSVFDRRTLALIDELAVPGAHGAGMTVNGRFFYTTNLPAGGTDGLWVIDTRRNMLVGDPVDTPYAVPHNIALTPNGKTLYVTHSGGSSDKVTVFRTRGRSPVPVFHDEVTVGLNPFGIAYVP